MRVSPTVRRVQRTSLLGQPALGLYGDQPMTVFSRCWKMNDSDDRSSRSCRCRWAKLCRRWRWRKLDSSVAASPSNDEVPELDTSCRWSWPPAERKWPAMPRRRCKRTRIRTCGINPPEACDSWHSGSRSSRRRTGPPGRACSSVGSARNLVGWRRMSRARQRQ